MSKKEYFNPENIFSYKNVLVPKELFLNEKYKTMSIESKMLYAIIRDRAYLSYQNNWIEDGHIFLIITREEIQDLLNISNKTAIKIVKELVKYDLLEERRQGAHKPNLLFPLEIVHDKKLDFLMCKNYMSRSVKNTSCDVKKLHVNHTNKNYTNKENIKYQNYEQRKYTKEELEKLYINEK